ncbi:TPA: hypothetical protein SMS45_000365 [Pseudomonas aeruginosa]|uniref:hypothetical protein n=1 Tax=Pseudomonas aeruginosa TaxID=287 RepID=UPI001CBBD2D2|nr:hypothetical protein [Pseudomonas aeruginosa]MCS9379236.1 hypothetical protein [Pseudomonas aeruginosa]HBP6280106.1 hypothetical protein [Pseudomonas aeruginosa]HCL4344354.1 hypothetical protein [Pseudomonas aeruginosa]HEK2085067.1 hypothetical protein [Pseudomonas aeruginosa]
MILLRFLGLLFVLVCLFSGSAAVVVLAILALRFWPLLLVIVLALLLFQHFMRAVGVQLKTSA